MSHSSRSSGYAATVRVLMLLSLVAVLDVATVSAVEIPKGITALLHEAKSRAAPDRLLQENPQAQNQAFVSCLQERLYCSDPTGSPPLARWIAMLTVLEENAVEAGNQGRAMLREITSIVQRADSADFENFYRDPTNAQALTEIQGAVASFTDFPRLIRREWRAFVTFFRDLTWAITNIIVDLSDAIWLIIADIFDLIVLMLDITRDTASFFIETIIHLIDSVADFLVTLLRGAQSLLFLGDGGFRQSTPQLVVPVEVTCQVDLIACRFDALLTSAIPPLVTAAIVLAGTEDEVDTKQP